MARATRPTIDCSCAGSILDLFTQTTSHVRTADTRDGRTKSLDAPHVIA